MAFPFFLYLSRLGCNLNTFPVHTPLFTRSTIVEPLNGVLGSLPKAELARSGYRAGGAGLESDQQLCVRPINIWPRRTRKIGPETGCKSRSDDITPPPPSRWVEMMDRFYLGFGSCRLVRRHRTVATVEDVFASPPLVAMVPAGFRKVASPLLFELTPRAGNG